MSARKQKIQCTPKVLILLLVMIMLGCNPESKETEVKSTVLSVETISLTQSDFYHVERQYVGSVKAAQQAKLGFELAGKVEALLVDVGDQVEKGTPLIKLDTALLDTELSQYQAQKHEVNAQLDLVAANLKRQRSLKSKGFSAEAEIDSLTSQQQVLQANLLRLDASIEANKLKQAKSTIFAPYAGVIAKRFVSLGDVVAFGDPTLTLLASQNKEAFIGIPTQQLSKVTASPNQKISIGGKAYPAKLLNAGALVDIQSRTVGLRYLLQQDPPVLEGELAYLLFNERIDQAGYWVPLASLIDGLRGVWNVFVVNKDNQVERRSVQVLFATSEAAYVVGAIEQNELLIASGLHRVVPGQQVGPQLRADADLQAEASTNVGEGQ